jgi:HSP20 family protein
MLVRWNRVLPFQHDFDVMGSMLGAATSSRTFEPKFDVRANDDELVLVCDVPGTTKDDLELTVDNQALTIRGTRKFQSKDGEQVILGRAYGSFSRTFELLDDVDRDRPAADLTDGVLTIRFRKNPKSLPKKIPIGSGTHAKREEEK